MHRFEIDFENMTDEEIDEYYRPKKINSRRSLAPLFVYLILKEKSSPEKHLSHREIADLLSNYPYEITIERKSLGRIIHNLEDSGLGIFSLRGMGTWWEG